MRSRDPVRANSIRLDPNISKTAGDASKQQSLITIDNLLWGSTVGYPNLASCDRLIVAY